MLMDSTYIRVIQFTQIVIFNLIVLYTKSQLLA